MSWRLVYFLNWLALMCVLMAGCSQQDTPSTLKCYVDRHDAAGNITKKKRGSALPAMSLCFDDTEKSNDQS